jgi:hypothetical protein
MLTHTLVAPPLIEIGVTLPQAVENIVRLVY